MGLHICNNCRYKDNCKYKFEQDFLCKSKNINIKIEQETRYTNELQVEQEYLIK